jgi:hypothetical protein
VTLRRHRLSVICQSTDQNVARPTGFEPVAFGSGGRRSIQLSYGREFLSLTHRLVARANERSRRGLAHYGFSC